MTHSTIILMKSKLLNNLYFKKDEDLRKSLFPIHQQQHESNFPQFSRHRDSSPSFMKRRETLQIKRINFNPNTYKSNQPLSFKQILPRYHDNSLVPKKRALSSREKILSMWSSLIKLVLLEGKEERIFKRDSNFLFIWNILVLYAYIFNIFEIPIAIFFTQAVYNDEFNTFAGLFLNWLAIAIIFINIIIVRPNTEFQNLGYLISNRKEIMSRYFGLRFGLNVFGLLVLLIYSLSQYRNLIFLKLFFYVDTPTIFSVDKSIIDKIELKSLAYAAYKLIRLLAYMLFILVWLSSIFFFIDYQFYINNTYPPSENWLTFSMCAFSVDADGNSQGTDLIATYPGGWYIWLNYAIYWALQTVSTVGYGDITPRNPPSVVFTNISILIMMFFFVFFINSVIEIIDGMTSSEEKQKKSNIKRFKLYYMNAKQKLQQIGLKYSYTPYQYAIRAKRLQDTSNRIRSYLHQMDINSLLEEDENVEQLVNQSLTPELRDELFINYRQLFFKRVLAFGQISKISAQFIHLYEQLIYKINEVPYGSNQFIYERGDHSTSLYYLLKGTITLHYPQSNYRKQMTFSPENIDGPSNPADSLFFNFGVRQFFTGEEKDHNASTQSYCKIQKLQYSDLIDVIKNHKNFYYKFCEIRDSMLIDKVNVLTGETCFQCKSRYHHLFQCEKCLFNYRIHIQRFWQEKYRIEVLGPPANNTRFPYFYRDKVGSQKINAKKIAILPQIREDMVLNSKFYRPHDNVESYESYEANTDV